MVVVEEMVLGESPGGTILTLGLTLFEPLTPLKASFASMLLSVTSVKQTT